MVNLTRIYTRTGDDGTTRLGDMSKTAKTDPRLIAYADTDEANSSIGVAIALGQLEPDVVTTLTRVQNELFDVGADLCNPIVQNTTVNSEGVTGNTVAPLRVEQADIDRLEGDCDFYLEPLEKLRSFILPGGTPGSALLHVSRTVARRAERSAWAALDVHGESMNPLTAKYLNRLSDLLFILARHANRHSGGDVLWVPGGSRGTAHALEGGAGTEDDQRSPGARS
jgi:cob(I)alamin adenosyltransferase